MSSAKSILFRLGLIVLSIRCHRMKSTYKLVPVWYTFITVTPHESHLTLLQCLHLASLRWGIYTNPAPEKSWITSYSMLISWNLSYSSTTEVIALFFFYLQIAFRSKLTFTHRIDVWITSKVHNLLDVQVGIYVGIYVLLTCL